MSMNSGPSVPRSGPNHGPSLAVLLACSVATQPMAWSAEPEPAADLLRAAYARLEPELNSNPFGRPLVMRSTEDAGSIRGEVYALVNFPLAQLSAAVTSPDRWCDIMILHLNTKYCRAAPAADGPLLIVHVGKKTPQALSETARVEFKYRVESGRADFLKIALAAARGPMGTSNYQMSLEAISINPSQSFLHLTYSYQFNLVSRAALGVYMTTLGSDKVGFTLAEPGAAGSPVYVKGLRALVERNTMRYFLAIQAYLESAQGPEASRLDSRLHNWFAATQTYARQLHEIELADYLTMKHAEVLRQQTTPAL